jgi:mono/diheme cytochrome c family protein
MRFRLRHVHVLALSLLIPATGAFAGHELPVNPATRRWYGPVDVERGREVYAVQCAGCHGDRAQGQPNWEERDESGYYPAPPLDGTGHSANHPITQMLRVLDTGGGSMGGTMPSFSDVLADDDKRAVIAWVQSLWPAAVYDAWLGVHEDE